MDTTWVGMICILHRHPPSGGRGGGGGRHVHQAFRTFCQLPRSELPRSDKNEDQGPFEMHSWRARLLPGPLRLKLVHIGIKLRLKT